MVMAETSVSHILADRYGIVATPGTKIQCPFCNHKTFSVKHDDSIGKCFHPSYGRFITAFHGEDTGISGLNKLLTEMFVDFHQYLIGQLDNMARTSYEYLSEKRQIHPQVIADSMIGAIPRAMPTVIN